MTNRPKSVLLFAAGLGTRMAPLTDTLPKPLVSVAGRPLIDHALQHCDGLTTVVNVHYRADQIENHLKEKPVLISDERDCLRDTGGGLKKALPLLGNGPVFTLNTDAVWNGPNPLNILNEVWNPASMDGLLLMVPHAAAVAQTGTQDFGVLFDINPDQTIQSGSHFVYSGTQIIRTDLLADIKDPAFSMWRLWDQMLAAGRLCGAVYPGQWCDVGRPETIKIAETMLGADHV